MIDSDEVKAFAIMFQGAKGGQFDNPKRAERRRKAERRAQMSERQLSRGGRVRNAQLNIRTTDETKVLAAKLAETLGTSLAEAIELAIREAASRKGIKDA